MEDAKQNERICYLNGRSRDVCFVREGIKEHTNEGLSCSEVCVRVG